MTKAVFTPSKNLIFTTKVAELSREDQVSLFLHLGDTLRVWDALISAPCTAAVQKIISDALDGKDQPGLRQ